MLAPLPSRAVRRHAAGLALLVAMPGCRNVLGIESTQLSEETGLPCAPAGSAEPSGHGINWWSGCGDRSTCFSARAPQASERPDASTEAADLPVITLAFDDLMLGSRGDDGKLDANAWKHLGFDLDGLCTASPTCSAAATDNIRTCKPLLADMAADGEYCRDNQVGLLDYNLDTLPQTSGKYVATATQLSCSLCQGGYNLLVRLSGYNGQLDDPSVRVDLYPSPGLKTLKNVDCSKEIWDKKACWTTRDAFTLDESAIEGTAMIGELGSATFYDPSAFVKSGWLVAQLPPNTPYGLVSMHPGVPPMVRIAINNGVLAMRLVKGTGGWSVPEGVLAGSTRLSALIDEFSRLGLCDQTAPAAAALVKTFMESAADMLSTGARSPNTPCDSLSLGLGLRAREATIGSPIPIAAPTSSACAR